MKTLNVIFSLFILTFCFDQSMAQVQVGAWEMHRGIDKEPISFAVGYHGDPKAYSKMNIPPSGHSGWSKAPVNNGKVNFSEVSSTKCKQEVDFTYFQSNILIPENTNIDEFTVYYDKADDGARIYFFNSKHPDGYFNSKADLILDKPSDIGSVNLKDAVVVGEVNRVVIVQFDDCATGNNVSGINVKVNGEVIEVEEEPIPNTVKTTVCCGTDAAPSTGKLEIGQWQIHRGVDTEPINFAIPEGKEATAYTKMKIPGKDHAGWAIAPLTDGKVNFSESSTLTCRQQLDFTYFQTNISVPKDYDLNDFSVFYNKADDGARIYFFNSKYPNGHFDAKADLAYGQTNPGSINLKDKVIAGEVNRVVIVQFDLCANKNNVQGINIKVNGEVVEPETAPLACANLVGRWTFEKGVETKDLMGNFGDLELKGANIENGALNVSNNKWARGIGYTGTELKDKTLVAWVKMNDLTTRSGSVLTIDKSNVDNFDGIIYGEFTQGQWMAGSDYHRRSNKGVTFRETKTEELVKMAISYEEVDGKNKISVYRNGELLDSYTKTSFAKFKDNVEIIFGTRHTLGNGPRSFVNATIEEARIYDAALCQEAIQELNMGGAEVELENVAVGKTARQSSEYRASTANASKAVDGNTDGAWKWDNKNSVTHTKDENGAWWEVDLGAVYDIRKMEIWNRTDCCWDRLTNLYVMVSENPITGNSKTGHQFSDGPHSFTSANHPSMIISGKKKGRYVRVFLDPTSGPLSLAEVEVFAVSSGVSGEGLLASFDGPKAINSPTDGVLLTEKLSATYSKEAWVNITPNNGRENNIVSGRGSYQHAFWAPKNHGYRLSAGHNGQWGNVKAPNPMPAGWHHVAVTYDEASKTMKLYQDGALVATNTNVAPIKAGDGFMQIGRYENGYNFVGEVKGVKVWSRVLTEAEIATSAK